MKIYIVLKDFVIWKFFETEIKLDLRGLANTKQEKEQQQDNSETSKFSCDMQKKKSNRKKEKIKTKDK